MGVLVVGDVFVGHFVLSQHLIRNRLRLLGKASEMIPEENIFIQGGGDCHCEWMSYKGFIYDVWFIFFGESEIFVGGNFP